MAYKFDPLKAQKDFDNMFGAGEYARSMRQADDIGRALGEAEYQKKLLAEQQRQMEAAKKEAAKKERERKKKEEEEKKKGRKETELSKQIDDKTFRLEQAGVDTAKKQSAFGKWANLDPDNNMFFDALDLLGRPLNTRLSAYKERVADTKDDFLEDLKSGNLKAEDMVKRGALDVLKLTPIIGEAADIALNPKKNFEAMKEGFSGQDKAYGSDVLEEAGMNKGIGRAVLGLGIDVAMDPLNVVGGVLGKGVAMGAKGIGKGIAAIPKSEKVLDPLERIFVGAKDKMKDLKGNIIGDDLIKTERQAENARLYMQNKSQEDVARSILQGGRESGERLGRQMEAPLRNPAPTNPLMAPNAASTNALMQNMPTPGGNSLTDPLDRITGNTFKTTDQGVNVSASERWGSRMFDVESTVARTVAATRKAPVDEAAKELAQHPSVSRAAQTLMDSNADLRKFASDNGIDIADIQGYMAHFITKEGRKALDESGEVVSDGAAFIGGNAKVMGREIHDTVGNANRKMKQKTGVDNFFNPDAFVATAGGQQRMINYIAKESVARKVLDDPRFAKELQPGQKAGKNAVEITKDGKRYAVTKGAKDVITNFERHVTDEGVNTLLKGFDTVQNAWKKTALFSLGFHARNALGNFWNMYASGINAVDVARYHASALIDLESIQARRVGRSAKATKKADETYDEFLQQGLKGTGSTADFAKDAEKAVMSDVNFKTKGFAGKMVHDFAEVKSADGALGKIGAAIDSPFAQSRRLGDASDEVSRFALFRWARDKGMSPEEAAAKVREVLFDYTALTNAERKVFRRMAPFYTWMRKNAEFQVKAFVKSPERYNKLNFTIQEGYANTDMNQEITPEWMKESMAIPMPGTDRLLQFNPPAADLAKMTDPGKMFVDSLSPLGKVPLESALNYSMFQGRPIKEFDGQTKEVLGMEMPAQLAYLAEQIGPVRNVSGSIQKSGEGAEWFDVGQQILGANMARQWNEESFQGQADWKENERLQGLIDKSEKQDDTDIETISDLQKQGVYKPGDHRADASASLQEMGFEQRDIDTLMSLKNKVYNNDAEYAAKTAETLRQMGLPPEVIDLITSEYLDY